LFSCLTALQLPSKCAVLRRGMQTQSCNLPGSLLARLGHALVPAAQVTEQLGQASPHPLSHSPSGKVTETAQRLVESQAAADAEASQSRIVTMRLECDLRAARADASQARIAAEHAGAQYAELLQQLRESERHGMRMADDLEAAARAAQAALCGPGAPVESEAVQRAEAAEAVAAEMRDEAARANAAHAELQVTAGSLQSTLEDVRRQLHDLSAQRDGWQNKCDELTVYATGAMLLILAQYPQHAHCDSACRNALRMNSKRLHQFVTAYLPPLCK
jgi:hypothetical protein